MTLSDDPRDLGSRTRPRPPKLPPLAHLTALRHASYSYLIVIEVTLAELSLVEGFAEIAYLKALLRVASGKQGSAFGTPHSIASLVDKLLGEQS